MKNVIICLLVFMWPRPAHMSITAHSFLDKRQDHILVGLFNQWHQKHLCPGGSTHTVPCQQNRFLSLTAFPKTTTRRHWRLLTIKWLYVTFYRKHWIRRPSNWKQPINSDRLWSKAVDSRTQIRGMCVASPTSPSVPVSEALESQGAALESSVDVHMWFEGRTLPWSAPRMLVLNCGAKCAHPAPPTWVRRELALRPGWGKPWNRGWNPHSKDYQQF